LTALCGEGTARVEAAASGGWVRGIGRFAGNFFWENGFPSWPSVTKRRNLLGDNRGMPGTKGPSGLCTRRRMVPTGGPSHRKERSWDKNAGKPGIHSGGQKSPSPRGDGTHFQTGGKLERRQREKLRGVRT